MIVSLYGGPLRYIFGLVTMSVINALLLEIIPIHVIGLITIIVLDVFLWWLISKNFNIYAAAVSFAGALGGFIWIGYWDVVSLINLFKHTMPNIGESLFMMLVGICAAGLFFIGFHYLLEIDTKPKSTEV